MKILLKSPKNTFLKMFHVFGHFRPIPATNQIDKNYENHQKNEKNATFQKPTCCCVVAGNMIFGRKSALWTPESPQKAYIDHPTQYGYILKKVKKIAFFTSKISIKKFFRPNILADVVRPPNQYCGSIYPIPAPKPL